MDITVSREIDVGYEIVSMLCRMALEKQDSTRPQEGRMRSACSHYLRAAALAPLRPALDALTQIEEHVLSGLDIDEDHLLRLFTSPQAEAAPAFFLYTGLKNGFSAERCAQEIDLTLRDEERSPGGQGMPLDAFVRNVTKLGFDRTYVLNLTQMLACWEEELAWLSGLLACALPRFEEKRALAQPLVEAWANALEPRLPQMRETGEICGMLRLQGDGVRCELSPALMGFASLMTFNPEANGTRLVHYGVLLDAISAAVPDVEDSQLITRLRALGDKRRLKIMRALVKRPRYAGEIAQLTQLSAATVSYHMTELICAQLVTAEDAGNRVLYRLSEEGLRALIADLSAMLK